MPNRTTLIWTAEGELLSSARLTREQFLKDWQWSVLEDTCVDIWAPSSTPRPWPADIPKGKVELPPELQAEAERYIGHITRVFPFQMRAWLADPMWFRYCDTWATGPSRWTLRERHLRSMRDI